VIDVESIVIESWIRLRLYRREATPNTDSERHVKGLARLSAFSARNFG
jgi:hypothetical protein